MKKKTKVALWIGAGLVVLGSTTMVVGPYLYVGYQFSVVSAPPVLHPTAAALMSAALQRLNLPEVPYFRDTALQFNQFPKATFTFANPVAVVCPRAGQPQSFTATGELTLHGVTKTVTVTLNVVLTSRISSESDPTVND
jgi:hypothetical protein